MDWKIELIPVNVSDVDASVEFYGSKVGWSIDHDQTPYDGLRFVQVTPPGSACSFCFGVGLGMLDEKAKSHIQIVVADADEARSYLEERGVKCTEVEDLAWGRFVHFKDPDENLWSMQELPPR
jgi:predicted enzyme related to lactoylglutathione lyase